MCRNIKKLYNFEPPPTPVEIHEAAVQFVRKVSGFNKPSAVNEVAFDRAIDDIAQSVEALLTALSTSALPLNREAEAEKARRKNALRFESNS